MTSSTPDGPQRVEGLLGMTRNAATSALVSQAWQDLLEKDDRTSPAEYPDMALITHDELAEMIFAGAQESVSHPDPLRTMLALAAEVLSDLAEPDPALRRVDSMRAACARLRDEILFALTPRSQDQ